MNWLRGLLRSLRVLEDSLLVGVFATMLLLAGTQIVMRNVFGSGFGWVDPLLRVLVLWVGMLGAVAATREHRHINIDVLSRFVPDGLRPWLARITATATTLVCALLAWHTLRFVRDEFAYSDVHVANLPVWVWESILPLGFGLMALRFAISIFIPPQPGQPA